MAVLRRPVNVPECPGVLNVLRDEADFMHRMVIEAVAGFIIPDLEPVHGDVDDDPLFVLAAGLNGRLELLKGVLTHAVAPGLRNLQHPDQLAPEHLALAHEPGVVMLLLLLLLLLMLMGVVLAAGCRGSPYNIVQVSTLQSAP